MLYSSRSILKKIFSLILLSAFALLLVQNANAQTPPLIEAVRQNNITIVKAFLNRGDDPNAYDRDSDNVLINAAIYASADCMQLLLEHKADPNLWNERRQTPLMYCASDLTKIKLLLDHGADINAKSWSKNTVFMIACMVSGNIEVLKYLLDHGADPFIKNAGKETPIIRAAQLGDTTTLRLLLDKGFDVNENPYGFTALTYAVRLGNWPSATMLLDNGADVNIADDSNILPVSWAGELNNLEITKRMLAKTHTINTIDSLAGMTPLMWAVYNEHDNPQIIQAFIDKGANVNIKARNGSTALSWAMKKGNTATVAVLKKAGAK